MHRICVAIRETGEWPEEWTFSTFIPLPNKGDLKQCANYRTIAVCLTCKQDLSSDHTGKDPSEDPKKLQMNRSDCNKEGGQETKLRISEYCCIMHVSISMRIQNEQLEQVDMFPYLGSLITGDGECTTVFRTTLNRGQAIRASLPKMWKSHGIPISTKIWLIKALVWPVAK